MDPLVLGAVIGLVFVATRKEGAPSPSAGASSGVGAETGREPVMGGDVEHAAATPGSTPAQYLDERGNPVSVTNDGAGPVVVEETGNQATGIGWGNRAPDSGAYHETVRSAIHGGITAVMKPLPDSAVIKPSKVASCSCVRAPCACSNPSTQTSMPPVATGGIIGAATPPVATGGIVGAALGLPATKGSKQPPQPMKPLMVDAAEPLQKPSRPGTPIIVQPPKATKRDIAKELQERGPAVGAVW